MPIEKSAGAVIFRLQPIRHPRGPNENLGGRRGGRSLAKRAPEKGKIYYLLLNYSTVGKIEKTYWGFPKGRIEKGEKEIEAVKREIKEETGLEDIQFVTDFKEREKYFFKFQGKNILKFVTFYLAETKTKEVKLSFEHIGYKWLPYEEALKQLTFNNTKEILEKAHKFLQLSEKDEIHY